MFIISSFIIQFLNITVPFHKREIRYLTYIFKQKPRNLYKLGKILILTSSPCYTTCQSGRFTQFSTFLQGLFLFSKSFLVQLILVHKYVKRNVQDPIQEILIGIGNNHSYPIHLCNPIYGPVFQKKAPERNLFI